MAKKAKRRGRPPGSKNKKTLGNSVATMDVAQLRAHIDQLQSVLAKKVNEQRAYFEGQLAELGGYVSKKSAAVFGGDHVNNGREAQRGKAPAKYRSKANPKLTWSGRGMTAGWLKEEMKATRKPKEHFAIK